MDSGSLLYKAPMLLGALCMVLSVQDVGAQATNSTVVPGWGIALLTMMSIMAALTLGFMMIIPCWCRSTTYDCQEGISFYSPHTMLSAANACQTTCQPTCQPACQPASQPSCQPACQPVCQPSCQPEPSCQPDCSPICQPDCLPTCQSECQSVSQSDSQSICESVFQPACEPEC
ncbi:keratin-associated protein 10-8-like [Rana temporaria]|uniref:keratin-associated protein 10-8-like n=1 Tax=Rana temporaria TaxID=8407 RepID=UPI001AACF295|nr:keratin-associated protein 10-8-like [Rana temporaria]